jgi:SAM-dependent methyltransferase
VQRNPSLQGPPSAFLGTVDAERAGAKITYDAFAAGYDVFNRRYMYERWTGRLLAKAEENGLSGKRLLDVGCGTGLSFITLLAQGWEVTGCDISPLMLEKAREKVGEDVSLVVADMRELPELGEFDLIWSVDDAVNYLMSREELEAALRGMRRNLAPDGIVLFDVNTLTGYRGFWSSEVVVEHDGQRFVWRGQGAEDPVPGSVFESRLGGEGQGVEEHVHRQRHFPEAEVLAAIEAAGLRCVEVAGELEGELSTGVDEGLHTKAVYVCKA